MTCSQLFRLYRIANGTLKLFLYQVPAISHHQYWRTIQQRPGRLDHPFGQGLSQEEIARLPEEKNVGWDALNRLFLEEIGGAQEE